MQTLSYRKVLVTGATGFIGRALVTVLRARGFPVVAASRRPMTSTIDAAGVEWRTCDLLRPETLPGALKDIKVAYYLVHSMGGGNADFRELERRAAETFVAASAKTGVERIVYLGGPAPRGRPSEHLKSRLQVGEILRAGSVSTVELRASMVIGAGGASWQIVRDLALRLPLMVMPKWLKSRTRPVALDDVLVALVGAADLPLQGSAWFDVPGPEVVSGRQVLERIAALRGRRILTVEVPLLTPQLSALWLKLVTRTDFTLARELVVGLREDLLPKDDRFWTLIGHTPLLSFDEAALRALAGEPRPTSVRERVVRLEERLVDLTATRGRVVEGDTAVRRFASTEVQRRLGMLALATSAWVVSFAVLARLGTWTAFAIAGTALVVAALVFGAVPADQLRPSLGTVGVGLVAGVLMVVLTHLAYAVVAPRVPEVRSATSGLLDLLNVSGFSPGVRAGLIAVIAFSEEVLFRGALPSSHAAQGRHRLLGVARGDLVQIVIFAAGYALATVPLGSVLLVVCAFVCAIVWGIVRFASGSLVAPIVAHVLWDLGVLVVWPLAASP